MVITFLLNFSKGHNSAPYQPVVESTELSVTAIGCKSVADRPIAAVALGSINYEQQGSGPWNRTFTQKNIARRFDR